MPIPPAHEAPMIDPVEEATDASELSPRERAEWKRGLVRRMQAIQAMGLAGFTGDEDPDPASYPGEG